MIRPIPTLVLALLWLAPLHVTSGAHAHPPHEWIPLRCCGEGDCFPIEGVQPSPGGWKLPDGRVIPFDRALRSRDPQGRFYECYVNGRRNEPRDRCFFAPEGRS